MPCYWACGTTANKISQSVLSSPALPLVLSLTLHCCIAAWGVIIFLGIAGAAISIAGGAGGASGKNHACLPQEESPSSLAQASSSPYNELQAILAASAKRGTAQTRDNLVTLVETNFLVAGLTSTSSLLE
jgi:hypothetical protein